MKIRYAISLVLNAHLPFVRDFPVRIRLNRTPQPETSQDEISEDQPQLPELPELSELQEAIEEEPETPPETMDTAPGTVEESWFFEALSETYLPLLEMFGRLEAEHIPFQAGIALSPILGQMLGDEYLLKKYVAYLDNQIDFGKQEMERAKGKPELFRLARQYFDQVIDRRAAFTTRYDGNILRALDHYRRIGNIEFIAAPASHSFLPFLSPFPEAVRAQIETAILFYRQSLGYCPQGFWLPELGWVKELDTFIRSYNFNYSITGSQGFVFGNPPPLRGTFFPVKTPEKLLLLGRDFCACNEIAEMQKNGVYRNNNRDIGHELPIEALGSFLTKGGSRYNTGYKYWQAGEKERLYDPALARQTAGEQARAFLEQCGSRLDKVSGLMAELPLCLCAFNADTFGRRWHEGTFFLEAMFRAAADSDEMQFITPSDYLSVYPAAAFEESTPEFSSWGENGYTESWLDSSNDWIYRHLNRAAERMTELADKFSENSGLKERALNQAARELLLAQASDWPGFLHNQECTEYAKNQAESALRNFTTIYESLGSSRISTEWLTDLERRHNIFPNINYRVFRRKK